MSVRDKESLLLNILTSILCQFESCAIIWHQAVYSTTREHCNSLQYHCLATTTWYQLISTHTMVNIHVYVENMRSRIPWSFTTNAA